MLTLTNIVIKYVQQSGIQFGFGLGHSSKIVPDVREFSVQFGQFVREDFGSAHCTVMHSDAIVFLFYKTITD